MSKIIIEVPSDLIEELVNESLRIPSGFFEEVYYDKQTKELSFGGPFTGNTWTEDPDKIGIVEAMDISDIEGFKTIDQEFVESDDNMAEIDPNFKDPNHEHYYGGDSSIITTDEAITCIVEMAINDEWFSEVVERYDEVVNCNEKQEVEA